MSNAKSVASQPGPAGVDTTQDWTRPARPPQQRVPSIDAAEIKRRFTFHTASTLQVTELEALRQEFIKLATTLSFLPEGREKALAFTNLEQAQFFANAAIVRPSG